MSKPHSNGDQPRREDRRIMAQFVGEKGWSLQVDGEPLGDDWLITVSLVKEVTT
jgi:hypothetical protein